MVERQCENAAKWFSLPLTFPIHLETLAHLIVRTAGNHDCHRVVGLVSTVLAE